MGTHLIRRFGLLAVAVGFAVAVLAPVAASAQTGDPDYPTTSTTPTTDCTGVPNTAVDVCGTSATRPPGLTVKAASATSGSLAFTGGNIALLVGFGLVAAVGGVVLVRLGRRAGAAR